VAGSETRLGSPDPAFGDVGISCDASGGSAPGNPKEADVNETSKPTTATGKPDKPPESDLVQTARDAGSAAQERFGDLRDAALSSLDEAKSAATEKVEETRDLATGEIARTADGLEAAAREMEGSPFQQDLLREAAAGLKQIAHAVEGKSIGAMATELSEFGRRNPVAYLGGAALVGFALARFARASTPAGTTAASSPASRDNAGSADRSPAPNWSGAEPSSTEFAGGFDHG
jgi:hypothetical protein